MEIRNKVVSDGYVISYYVESNIICQVKNGHAAIVNNDPTPNWVQALFDSYMRQLDEDPNVILSEVKEKRLNHIKSFSPETLSWTVNRELIPKGVELLGSPQIHVDNGTVIYTQFYMEIVN